MAIRPLHEHDAPALAPLCRELGYPASPVQLAARLRALLADRRQALFGFDAAGTLVGWIHVQRVLHLEADPFAEVCGLVVDGHHRGQGVGTALLAAAEGWAVEAGLRTVRIRCNVVRTDTHRFYERRGYEPEKTQRVFARVVRHHLG